MKFNSYVLYDVISIYNLSPTIDVLNYCRARINKVFVTLIIIQLTIRMDHRLKPHGRYFSDSKFQGSTTLSVLQFKVIITSASH